MGGQQLDDRPGTLSDASDECISLRQIENPGCDISTFFRLHRTSVFRYLYSMLRNRTQAEDLTQETFVRLLTEIKAGKAVHNMRVWIFRVARNLAIDSKRNSRHIGTFMEREICSNELDPEQLAIQQQRESAYLRRLTCLSPQEHHCLELRSEGLPYREIADVLGISISSVRTFLVRAFEKLSAETYA
jgi:RNA polymerase sigma-70 factor, ECF subfamily